MQRPRSFDNEWQVSYWQLSVNEIKGRPETNCGVVASHELQLRGDAIA
jgi:hypothetical protein